MIPIRDHNPSGKLPLITYSLILINTAVFFYMISLPVELINQFISQYSFVPSEIVRGNNLFTLITAMFLHGSLGHLIGNMLFLRIFGDNLEDYLGHLKFLGYYLLCGLGGSLLQVLVSPSLSIPNLGASGAIAGTMGGYLFLFPRHKIEILFSFGWSVRRSTVPAYTMIFYWLLAQVFGGVGSLAAVDQMTGGIAYFAHLGGFVTGWLGLQIFNIL